MPYNPTYPPSNSDDLIRWLADELLRINPDILQEQEYFSFSPISVEPARPTIGEIKWADGVNWDPGAGMGLYEYIDIGWTKLGAGNGGIVPVSHSFLQDLLADDHPQYHNDVRGDVRYYPKSFIDAHFGDFTNPHKTTVANIEDTVITAPQDKDVLSYDTLTSKWINAVSTGGGGDSNPDGGRADSIYTPPQLIDGGFA